MTLILNEQEARWEWRDGRVLILWFHWDRERTEYVTDRKERLGASWPDAYARSQAAAGKRRAKAAKA